ncbi:DUF2807 domain-containing protein [Halosquirtibacter laminarini]|uniref:DUF2807 domain-containing protein n=1 Tax=Halosquirtibacter laminarini TaxID=3374600 RepID=A0AC61NI84_9BACT|nr:DUF2807 domain-containing protein [Prolixibacteraceae bacterium]
MKKIKWFLMFVLSFYSYWGIAQETKPLKKFTSLEVGETIHIILKYAKNPSLEIHGDPAYRSRVRVIQQGRSLILTLKKELRQTNNHNHKNYLVLNSPVFNKISLHGYSHLDVDYHSNFGSMLKIVQKGSATIKGKIQVKRFENEVYGASACNLEVLCNRLIVKSLGSGTIDLKTSCQQFNFTNVGSSRCNLSFKAQSGILDLDGVGVVQGRMEVSNLKCYNNNTGDLLIDVLSSRFDLIQSTMSISKLRGSAGLFSVQTVFGNVYAKRLASQVCYVDIASDASVYLGDTKKLHAIVRPKGMVYYQGTPHVNVPIEMSSRVKRVQ